MQRAVQRQRTRSDCSGSAASGYKIIPEKGPQHMQGNHCGCDGFTDKQHGSTNYFKSGMTTCFGESQHPFDNMSTEAK